MTAKMRNIGLTRRRNSWHSKLRVSSNTIPIDQLVGNCTLTLPYAFLSLPEAFLGKKQCQLPLPYIQLLKNGQLILLCQRRRLGN